MFYHYYTKHQLLTEEASDDDGYVLLFSYSGCKCNASRNSVQIFYRKGILKIIYLNKKNTG